MMKTKYVLVALLTPALFLAGCQKAEAKTTVKAVSYKKVYLGGNHSDPPVLDYFIFYDKSGHKHKVSVQNVEYKYNITTGNFTKAEVVIENGDPVEAVITLPVSQDKGME